MAKIIFSFDMRVYFSCKGIKVVEMLVNILRDIVSYLISCYTVNDCTLCCGVAAAVPLKTDTKCITPKQSAIHKIIVEVDRLTVDCIVIFCIIDICIKNNVNYQIYGIAYNLSFATIQTKEPLPTHFCVHLLMFCISPPIMQRYRVSVPCSLPGSRYPLPFSPSIGK